jgi:sugar phosphate isomerase/epimerase
MARRRQTGWWTGVTLGVALCWGGSGLRAAETAPPSPPPKDGGAPALYGFCMDTHDARKRSLPEQAQLLRELGFDGVGYPLWLDDNLEKNLRTLDDAGLKLYLVYATVKVKADGPAFDPRVPEAIRKLKGRPTTVCVLLQGLPPGDPRGMDVAVKTLRQLGDVAAAAGLRISIYHHTGDWTASLLHTLQVVQQVNHPQVGANFNLCHWLMVDGDKDYRPVLREHAAQIFAVTINGAQLGTKTWTNGLIQPLDQGDFDNRQLLATLREIGYRGPIGLMCYGIAGDAREHLERSRKVWQSWHQ